MQVTIKRNMRGEAIRVEDHGTVLKVLSPFSCEFVDELKRTIPSTSRAWEKPYWSVSKKHVLQLYDAIAAHFDIYFDLPDSITIDPSINVIIVEYIGVCKDRPLQQGIPSPSAYAYVDGGWKVLFPEDVLREFFCPKAPKNPKGKQNYFELLGLTLNALEDEVKKAYRKLARQWHPDVCKEPGAENIFKEINEANEVLSDPKKRKKYKKLLIDTDKADNYEPEHYINQIYGDNHYRPMMRCGMVTVEGEEMPGGKFIVSRILAWDDVYNDLGQVMTSNWVMDLENFVISWVNP